MTDRLKYELFQQNRSDIVNFFAWSNATIINDIDDFPSPIWWIITLESSKVYVLWTVIDMTWSWLHFEVPSTWCYMRWYNFDLSWITCSDNNYTLFTSSSGGSWNVLMTDMLLETSWSTSRVFDLTDSNWTHAIEFNRVNFNNCSSLWEIDWYRQWLESGTGRFWWSPSITLSGTRLWWRFIDTSIVRWMSDTTTEPLYKEWTSFTMASRFRSNQNIDLWTLQPFFDFSPGNFISTSTVQLDNAIISRDWVFNPNDGNITPNMTNSDLVSLWKWNNGINNTFVWWLLDLTVEVETVITTQSVYETLLWTFTPSDLQHFDSPSNGQIRHLGETPREYKVTTQFALASSSNNIVSVRIRKYDSSTTTTSTVFEQEQQVNNFAGSRDVAFSTIITKAILDQNDYLFMEVSNESWTWNITAELRWFLLVESR